MPSNGILIHSFVVEGAVNYISQNGNGNKFKFKTNSGYLTATGTFQIYEIVSQTSITLINNTSLLWGLIIKYSEYI